MDYPGEVLIMSFRRVFRPIIFLSSTRFKFKSLRLLEGYLMRFRLEGAFIIRILGNKIIQAVSRGIRTFPNAFIQRNVNLVYLTAAYCFVPMRTGLN
jgi:hypothetical protein